MKNIIKILVPVCCLGMANCGKFHAQNRPNILWLTFEDTSPHFIGCYGNEQANTPVMDKLAAEGVRFTNAYSNNTVSSPSRFCLITGCRTNRYGTGNHRGGYEIPAFVHGFPAYLRKAGYYTSNNSKTDYNHQNHREMTRESWNESSNKASWRGRKPGQPFFAVFNAFHSHQSRTMTNPWEYYQKQVLDKLDDDRVLQPTDDFEIPPFYCDTPEMRKEVSRVYNSISLVDQEFGKILSSLQTDGLKDSTIIFCFADHGQGIPRCKGSATAMGYKVPFVMWIPEMYRHLTPWKTGVVTDQLVSFEDFSATVLKLAGVELPDYMEGTPFLPCSKKLNKKYMFGSSDAVDGNMETSRSVCDGKYMYTRVFTNYQPFVRWIAYYDHAVMQHLMRKDYRCGRMNADQQHIMEPRAIEYLYDMEKDPWELNNLAERPEFQEKLNEFRLALTGYLVDIRDANLIPEYSLDGKIPYELRLDDKFYPVRKVVDMAMLGGQGVNVLQRQIDGLRSSVDLVVYWASVGLFSQGERIREMLPELKKIANSVSYPPARLWLAATILNQEDDSCSRTLLEQYLTSTNDFLRVYALNVLTVMELSVAQSFCPILDQVSLDSKNNFLKSDLESMMNVVRMRLQKKEFKYSMYW